MTTIYKGELKKGDQLIFKEVEISLQTINIGGRIERSGQLFIPNGQKLRIDTLDPSFDFCGKDGSLFTIYIEKRNASYSQHGSSETFYIRAIPSMN